MHTFSSHKKQLAATQYAITMDRGGWRSTFQTLDYHYMWSESQVLDINKQDFKALEPTCITPYLE